MRYDWQRYWVPRGQSPKLLDRGFLLDPESEWAWAYGPTGKTLADLADIPCLVLLGEPGIGKSDVLLRDHAIASERNARQSAVAPLWVDLRSFGDEDRLERRLTTHPDIQRWIQGDGILELFLDSLDECLLRIDTVATLLPDTLSVLPWERLCLRIACRTGDWPSTLEHGLARLWGEEKVGVFELAPLRRADIVLAAEANGLDPDGFLAEIADREAEPLANRPVTLDFLLRTRREGTPLPARRADLYLKGCQLLAAEGSESRIDAGRRGGMGAAERIALATRIAAATVFSNRYAVWTGSEARIMEPEDLSPGDIPLEGSGVMWLEDGVN